MANVSSSANASFGAGVHHATNTGRANAGSITLGADAGLQADSQRWDSESHAAAVSPHSVLAAHTFAPSANGTSGEHFMPGVGFLGSANGMSSTGYRRNLMLGYAGHGTNDLP